MSPENADTSGSEEVFRQWKEALLCWCKKKIQILFLGALLDLEAK